MNRRSFLTAAAAAAFAPATLLRAAEGKRRVVVVGAGLAGLSCAYELRTDWYEINEHLVSCSANVVAIVAASRERRDHTNVLGHERPRRTHLPKHRPRLTESIHSDPRATDGGRDSSWLDRNRRRTDGDHGARDHQVLSPAGRLLTHDVRGSLLMEESPREPHDRKS